MQTTIKSIAISKQHLVSQIVSQVTRQLPRGQYTTTLTLADGRGYTGNGPSVKKAEKQARRSIPPEPRVILTKKLNRMIRVNGGMQTLPRHHLSPSPAGTPQSPTLLPETPSSPTSPPPINWEDMLA